MPGDFSTSKKSLNYIPGPIGTGEPVIRDQSPNGRQGQTPVRETWKRRPWIQGIEKDVMIDKEHRRSDRDDVRNQRQSLDLHPLVVPQWRALKEEDRPRRR